MRYAEVSRLILTFRCGYTFSRNLWRVSMPMCIQRAIWRTVSHNQDSCPFFCPVL